MKVYGTYFELLTFQLHTTICDMVTMLKQNLLLHNFLQQLFFPYPLLVELVIPN